MTAAASRARGARVARCSLAERALCCLARLCSRQAWTRIVKVWCRLRGRRVVVFDTKPPGKLLADDDAASSGAVDDFVDAGTWPTRCLLKCAPEVSIKKTTRMGAKIDEYERDKGGGLYPYCAFIGDSLRASIVCEDAEAFWKTYEALRGDPDDPAQRFRVLRLKNKLGVGKEPFNFHLNCSFHPSTFRAPIQLEIQIWAAAIMDLNDVSHWQYEVARAGSVGAF